ncbi:hypothetical protein Hanom_Chr05g00403321 [Helianthus anomalus]
MHLIGFRLLIFWLWSRDEQMVPGTGTEFTEPGTFLVPDQFGTPIVDLPFTGWSFGWFIYLRNFTCVCV